MLCYSCGWILEWPTMQRRLRYMLSRPRTGTIEYVALIAGCGLHLLTVFVAFHLQGFLGAGLSFLFPVAAQVYWIVDLWERSGVFWNVFTLICAAYVLLWAVVIVRHLLRYISHRAP